MVISPIYTYTPVNEVLRRYLQVAIQWLVGCCVDLMGKIICGRNYFHSFGQTALKLGI